MFVVALRPIVLFGDPVLRSPTQPVTQFDARVRQVVKDLLDTVDEPGRAGLAATQIGVDLRIFSYNVDDAIGYVINPELVELSEETQRGDEGCLSIPDLRYDTRRRMNAVAHGADMFGNPLRLEGSGLLARCFQHETDHLDGILFIDRLDPEARAEAIREIAAADWNSVRASEIELDFARSLV